MEHILPISQTHISDTSGGEIVDILHATCSSFEAYLYSNYLLVTYSTAPSSKHNMVINAPRYSDCPLFYYQKVNETNEIRQNVLPYVKENLHNGHYMFIDMNERYLYNSLCYQMKDRIHHHLVYGYSDEQECIYLRNTDRKGHFVSVQIPYAEFELAVQQRTDNSCIEHLKRKEHDVYEIDWWRIYNEARNAVTGMVSQNGNIKIYVGVIANDKLIEIMDDIKKGNYTADVRQLAVFKEHKRLMIRYMDFFVRHDMITDDIKPIVGVCSQMAAENEMLMLKFELTSEKRLLEKIQQNIRTITRHETMVYPLIAQGIERYLLSLQQ